jgi:hypothetical protein
LVSRNTTHSHITEPSKKKKKEKTHQKKKTNNKTLLVFGILNHSAHNACNEATASHD